MSLGLALLVNLLLLLLTFVETLELQIIGAKNCRFH